MVRRLDHLNALDILGYINSMTPYRSQVVVTRSYSLEQEYIYAPYKVTIRNSIIPNIMFTRAMSIDGREKGIESLPVFLRRLHEYPTNWNYERSLGW